MGKEVPASAVEKQEPRRLATNDSSSVWALGHAGLHDGAFVVMVDGSGRLGVVVLVVWCAWRLLFRGRRLGTAQPKANTTAARLLPLTTLFLLDLTSTLLYEYAAAHIRRP